MSDIETGSLSQRIMNLGCSTPATRILGIDEFEFGVETMRHAAAELAQRDEEALHSLQEAYSVLEAERNSLKVHLDKYTEFISFLTHYLDADSDERCDWEFLDDRWKQLAIDSAKARQRLARLRIG